MTPRRTQALLLVIILVGAALRSYNLGAQSLWFDELVSVIVSRMNLTDTLAISATIDPPLYYLLLHFWLSVSNNDAWIRALSAFAGIATIPALYLLTKQLWDAHVALLSAFIFAIAPLQLFYAQEARMYSLLVLFSTLAIWAYRRAQKYQRTKDWFIWATLMALAIYAHIFAGWVLVALDVDALWRWRVRRASLRSVILSNLGIGLTLVPWMWILVPNLNYIAGVIWLTPPNILQPLVTLMLFIFGYAVPFPINVIAQFVVLVAFVFLLIGSWIEIKRRDTELNDTLRLLFLCGFLPIVGTFLISQWRPLYLDRWLLETTPPLYGLIAWSITHSARRVPLRWCAGIALPLILVAIANYYFNPIYAKSPYREAINIIVHQRVPDELIVHTSGSTFLAGLKYDPQGNHMFLNHPNDRWLDPSLLNRLQVSFQTDPRTLITGRATFWVLVALDHLADEQQTEKAEFDRLAVIMEQKELGGISVLHYRAP